MTLKIERTRTLTPMTQLLRWENAETDEAQWMRVKVVETGEEVDYKLTDILDDPRER